jgi:N-acetyl-anhydromuramyl-L-alanine amidase AmpD
MAQATSGWMPGVTIRKSPNYWSGHNDKTVKAAVIHVTGGKKGDEYPNAVSWLSDRTSGVSAHFVVSQAGDITQLVSIYDSAWANGASYKNGQWYDPEGNAITPAWVGMTIPTNPNWTTISLETARQSSDPMSTAMFNAVVRILQWIASEFNWTYIAHNNIVGHNEISPVSRPYCPGPNVSLTKLAAAANTTPKLQKFVVVSKDALNIREGHGINPDTGVLYPIALNGTAKLKPGTIIEVDAIYSDGWCHLAKTATQADLGFVSGAFLQAVPE